MSWLQLVSAAAAVSVFWIDAPIPLGMQCGVGIELIDYTEERRDQTRILEVKPPTEMD